MTLIHSQRTVEKAAGKQPGEALMSIYRYQLSAIMETERGLVALGLLKQEERRFLSRQEQRQLTPEIK